MDDYDAWLFNPKWKNVPSIVFKNDTPLILTCKDHEKGCNNLHIYCCRWKYNLLSASSDQLCHTVEQPQTVNNTQVGYNSIGYQVMLMERNRFC